MTKTHTLWRLIVVVVLASVAVAAQGRRWDDLYREAVAHVARRQWRLAEEKLERAMKEGPPSGRGVIRRGFMNRDDYFPEFYLGIVYLNTNRGTEALTQFKVARARGIDLKDSDFRRLPELETKASAMADAEASRRAADAARNTFNSQMDEARRLLENNRFDEAASAAQRAKATNVDNVATDTLLAAINERRAAEELKLRTAREAEELRAANERQRATSERQAMLEFFGGNYQRSLNLLAEAEKATALTARGQFYRAVSYASLAVRGKETNQSQLRAARRAWASANQQAGVFQADLAYISPEVLRLLQAR